jgi:hypothetical protein
MHEWRKPQLIESCPDYEELKASAKLLGRKPNELFALSPGNDPFYITPARQLAAEWFAGLWERFEFSKGTHLRRVHYILISNPISLPSGEPYENTEKCWSYLGSAGRDARYLSLIPPWDFVDRRNPEPQIFLLEPSGAVIGTTNPRPLGKLKPGLPALPKLELNAPVIPQRYHIELWAEKSTQNEILRPLARSYHLNLVTGVGEMSLTACDAFIQRAKRSGRPVRVLYVSDFDPAGLSMPVAVARKIEFGLRDSSSMVDVQVRPVVLTQKQCEQYSLPRTPIKEGERRADAFQYRYGDGATELDALEALHPGKLREIIEAELERYHDRTLGPRIASKVEQAERVLDQISSKVIERHDLTALEEKYRELVETYNTGLEEIEKGFNEAREAIARELWEKAPGRINWPEPGPGNDDADPMFSSLRGYQEQVARYRLHQEKHKVRPKQDIPVSVLEALGITLDKQKPFKRRI